MSNGLKQYFPMIQTREELCKKIQTTPELKFLFDSWDESQQEEFLQFCTGMQLSLIHILITVGENDNTIIVVPGANGKVDRDYIDRIRCV